MAEREGVVGHEEGVGVAVGEDLRHLRTLLSLQLNRSMLFAVRSRSSFALCDQRACVLLARRRD